MDVGADSLRVIYKRSEAHGITLPADQGPAIDQLVHQGVTLTFTGEDPVKATRTVPRRPN